MVADWSAMSLSDKEEEALGKLRTQPLGKTISQPDAKANQILPRRFEIGSRHLTPQENADVARQISSAIADSNQARERNEHAIWGEVAQSSGLREGSGQQRYWSNALSKFLILEDEAQAAEFAQAYPQFFPLHFFKLQMTNHLAKGGIDTANAPEIGLTGFRSASAFPLWRAWRNLLLRCWHSKLSYTYVAQLISVPTALPADALPNVEFQPVYDFQRCVLWIMLEQWRARFCTRCGRPFVAAKQPTKHCGETCKEEAEKERNRRHWKDYGRTWRRKKRAEAKQSRRTKKTKPKKKKNNNRKQRVKKSRAV